jgi:hypothetical protein
VAEFKSALEKAGVRVETDCRDNYTPGWKYNAWELKGVPVRVELGPRDMDGGVVVLARRDTGELFFFSRAGERRRRFFLFCPFLLGCATSKSSCSDDGPRREPTSPSVRVEIHADLSFHYSNGSY